MQGLRRTEHESKNIANHFDNNQLAAPAGLGRFTLPDGSCGSVDTVANAGNDTSDNHLRDTKSSNLENGTNAHNGGAKQNRLFAAERLADPNGGDGAKEAAHIVNGRDGTLQFGIVGDAQQVEKVGRHDDAAKDTLIVS